MDNSGVRYDCGVDDVLRYVVVIQKTKITNFYSL